MGVRKNSFVVNSIISYFPVKWEVFLLNFFRRQSCAVAALTHKFNFIFLSYKNITFLTAFSWFSESQGIVSP